MSSLSQLSNYSPSASQLAEWLSVGQPPAAVPSPVASAVQLQAPIQHSIADLQPSTVVLLSGTVYAARDAAHKRLVQMLQDGEELPFPVEGQIIYYTGPTPSRASQIIGSAGPTSSYRMDPYTPPLLELGLQGCIGKGERSAECMAAFARHGAKYFLAVGGTGALISQCIRASHVIAFEDLGPEAIHKLEIENMRLIVA